MKPIAIGALVAVACSLVGNAPAQYKGPRSYFPKNYPAPQPGGNTAPGATNSPANSNPAARQPSKFKDVPVNTGFYFQTDTNRTYLWTKTSTSQAKNTKNGVVQTISGEAPIQR